jgi:prefoldin alpha subunit
MSKKALRENYLKMKLMESQLKSEMQQKSMVENALEEMKQTIEAIREISNMKKTEAFFSLGSGAFIEAQLKANIKIQINSGAGILSEKNPQEALEIMKERVKNGEESLKEIEHSIFYLTEEIRKTEERMNLISTHAEAE